MKASQNGRKMIVLARAEWFHIQLKQVLHFLEPETYLVNYTLIIEWHGISQDCKKTWTKKNINLFWLLGSRFQVPSTKNMKPTCWNRFFIFWKLEPTLHILEPGIYRFPLVWFLGSKFYLETMLTLATVFELQLFSRPSLS